ncbi:DUF4099 domain-containing protein, partial [Phocaeicola vulgatus]
YKFDEHQLPWKDLNALGLDKETLFLSFSCLSTK